MEEQDDKKTRERLVKIIATVVFIFIFIVLIIIKAQVESFPLIWVFIGGFLIAAGILGTWKGIDIYRKLQLKGSEVVEGKLPPMITEEQAAEIIEEKLKNPKYADYVVGWKQSQPYVVGKTLKQTVLLVQLEETPYSSAPFQFFIINLHYPRQLCAYVEQQKYNTQDLWKRINAMVTDPSEEPDVKITEEESPLTGIKRKTTEVTKKKKKLEEKKEELQ